MDRKHIFLIMLFCTGLFLIGVGVYLFTYNHIESINWLGPPYLNVYITQPYSGLGVAMIIVGTVLAVIALVGMLIKKETE